MLPESQQSSRGGMASCWLRPGQGPHTLPRPRAQQGAEAGELATFSTGKHGAQTEAALNLLPADFATRLRGAGAPRGGPSSRLPPFLPPTPAAESPPGRGTGEAAWAQPRSGVAPLPGAVRPSGPPRSSTAAAPALPEARPEGHKKKSGETGPGGSTSRRVSSPSLGFLFGRRRHVYPDSARTSAPTPHSRRQHRLPPALSTWPPAAASRTRPERVGAAAGPPCLLSPRGAARSGAGAGPRPPPAGRRAPGP